MSYTPGPWGATTRRGSWDWVVYQQANPNIEICQPFHDDTEFNETGEANARLIAAAPDLADALVRIERGCVSVLLDAALNEQPINPEVLEQIIKDIGAALTKAKGTPEMLGRNSK